MPLCIIDMQDEFGATRGAIKGVLREIKLAKERKDHIIVVEFRGCGPTNHIIVDALEGYKKVYYCIKEFNDGSNEIVAVARKKRFKLDCVRVVGVNLGYCVAETVDGLAKRKNVGRIIVPLRATNCDYGMEHGKNTINHVKSVNAEARIRIVT